MITQKFTYNLALLLLLLLFIHNQIHANPSISPRIEQPIVKDIFGTIPEHFDEYEVILQPDQLKPEWWAGAPSVVQDDEGVFWMACRMRSAELPRGLRGYEIRILRSEDGIHFENVHQISNDDVPMKGFERPALLIDPNSGQFKLYACGPWQDGPWSIIKFDDADSPMEFDPSTARAVISPLGKEYERDVIPIEYKDPVIVYAEGAYHAYLIGYLRRNERIYHFKSEDGEQWHPVGNPYESVMELDGWHDFFVRPASLLSVGVGYLFIYEGSSVKWYDPVYNICTGIAFTFDLHEMIDLTPKSPLVCSNTPNEYFSTFRYSHWMKVNNEIWVYAEVATPGEYHEIRLYRLPNPTR